MSNINQIAANQELFTELSNEEGSVIQGGYTVTLEKIVAINAGADNGSKDDLYVKIGGNKIGPEHDMGTGDTAYYNISVEYQTQTNIDLFDADGWLNPDDHIGTVTAMGFTYGTYIQRVSGSGSTYDVYYNVH